MSNTTTTTTYRVVKVLPRGKVQEDSKSYRTESNAFRRLLKLVQQEEQQCLAGFGKAHEWRIRKEVR